MNPPLRPDLAVLATRIPPAPLTRFAPSPTGYLHLGHVVNAIYVWGLARALEGRVLLRIEDHDRVRSRAHFETALLEDLDWLGFVPDAGLPPVRQSDRPGRYHEALERLRRTHAVYACGCSRKEIGGERYPGTCRTRALPEHSTRGMRVRIDDDVERFDDALLGTQAQMPARQAGDILLRDRLGQWTYQFAVTVDDWRDDVSLVIRGADLLSSTGRQIALARLLGRTSAAVYLHHPLVVGSGGVKLSKARGDTGVRELRHAGLLPEEVIGLAAAAVGLIPAARPVPAVSVSDLFRG